MEPAFPRPGFAPQGYGVDDFDPNEAQAGMTLRDYFAAKAMQSLVDRLDDGVSARNNNKFIAQVAYQVADAMLEERKK